MKALLFGLLLFLFIVPPVFAQETLQIETITVTPTSPPVVQYDLPYPGILPDNPLYALKAARDRLVSFFISDPMKKSEFDLLQSDKRIQAGLFLLHKDKPNVSLALSTISKGQNYFEEAVTAAEKAKANKKTDIGDLPDHLTNAATRYDELLQKESVHIPAAAKNEFHTILTRSQALISQTEPLHTAAAL